MSYAPLAGCEAYPLLLPRRLGSRRTFGVTTNLMRSEQYVNVWRERAVYALLFVMPMGGMSVRHWLSATFLFLALLALPELWRRPWNLERSEQILLALLGGFFVLFVATGVANGWTDEQSGNVGREIRFLVAIPIYLMMRRLPDAGLWLVRGGTFGGLVLLAQAIYDTEVLGRLQAQGIYSPNLLGPFAAMLAAFALALWRIERADSPWRYVVVPSALAALTAMVLTASRGALVGLIGMLAVWGGMRLRGWRMVLPLTAAAAAVAVGYFTVESVHTRFNRAVTEITDVVEEGRLSEIGGARLDSVSTRIEMWRVSGMIFRDNPIFGVGRGNYMEAARKYVEQGRVHPEVVQHSHPHNAYLEALISKGIFGFADFLAMLLFPLYVFARSYRASPDTALLGILHITGFALFSLTDASTIIKGNYVAIWLVYLTAFYAWHMRLLRVRTA